MNNWNVIFATVVIFGAGVLTGGFLVGNVQHQHWRNYRRAETAATNSIAAPPTNSISQGTNQPGRVRLPEILNKPFLQRLDEELHLSADEHEAIQKIITDSQNLIHKTMLDARLEIREQLTPEQRTQFDELVKRPLRRANNSTNASAIFSKTNFPTTNAPGR